MTATTAPGPGERRRWRRRAGFASLATPLVLVVSLAACGGDDGDVTGPTTVTIKPNSYATVPVVAGSTTTVEGASGGTAGEDGRVPGIQEYIVRPGDFLSSIASRLGIDDYNEICEINRWDDCPPSEFYPEMKITIPPGALDVSAIEEERDNTEAESDSGDDDETASTEEESPTDRASAGSDGQCPDGSDQATYAIEADDTTRVGVAEKLDVTVEQLDAANANTPGYSAFYPGLEILVPCRVDD